MQVAGRSARDIILDRAQELIIRYGYAGLSIRELAQGSGLAKGTIYYHFQDKEEIYFSALERNMLNVRTHITEAAASSNDPIEQLRAVMFAFFGLKETHNSLIFAALREINDMKRQLRDLVNEHRRAILEPVIAIIEQGIRDGLFRPHKAEISVMSLFFTMHGLVTHHCLLQESEISHGEIEEVLDFYLHGLFQREK